MAEKKSFVDNLVGNVLFKILQFIVFSLITSTPYLINNLDKVSSKVAESGVVGFMVVLEYLKVITASIWVGMCIGLSTVFYTMTHLKDVFGEQQIGTIIYSIVVLVFATLTFFQPIDLIFGIMSNSKGKEHSAVLSFIVALVLVVVVAAPICGLLNHGETITSGLEKKVIEEETEEIPENVTANTTEERLVNSINMLTGDES